MILWRNGFGWNGLVEWFGGGMVWKLEWFGNWNDWKLELIFLMMERLLLAGRLSTFNLLKMNVEVVQTSILV